MKGVIKMNKVKNFCSNNSVNILTGLGVVGVASTAVLAAKATPKALYLLEQKEEFKQAEYGYPLTKTEKVLAVAPAYIPAVLTGLATVTCILGANRVNKVKQASLMSAYTYLNNSYEEYKRKVKEVFGEDGATKVDHELQKEIELYNQYGSLHETRLFYDEYSKRYFEMSMYEIKEAEYKINRMFNFLGEMKLNEVYEFLNLAPIETGEDIGWSAFKDWECLGFSWIELLYEEIETKDGLTALSLKFNMDPSADYQVFTY